MSPKLTIDDVRKMRPELMDEKTGEPARRRKPMSIEDVREKTGAKPAKTVTKVTISGKAAPPPPPPAEPPPPPASKKKGKK